MTAAKKYFLIVLAVEGVLVFAVIVLMLVLIATSYNGQCADFNLMLDGSGSRPYPCSFFEHMAHYSELTLFFGFLIALSFWWLSVPIALLAVFAPIVAYVIGSRRSVMPSIVVSPLVRMKDE